MILLPNGEKGIAKVAHSQNPKKLGLDDGVKNLAVAVDKKGSLTDGHQNRTTLP